MSQPLRTQSGGGIDRSRLLHFRFDGRAYVGHPGDTLASALLANGVRVTGRSFKYHRPRGLLAAGFEEPNSIVQLGHGAEAVPNLKATQVELVDGLEARAVNSWPSARFDVLGFLRFLKPFMPSGFYYKTFIFPSWHWFEGLIRAAAGLGRSPRAPDPARYDKRYDTVELLVIGGGSAGLTAAIEGAAAGKNVLLVDDKGQIGGDAEIGALATRLQGLPNARVLSNTTAFGYYDHNYVVLAERAPQGDVRERLWHVRAAEVVLATGAIERPIVFPNNDRPGVMLASAARAYLQRYGVLAGRRLVIATNNDSAYAAALELLSAGAEIGAILDSRPASDHPDSALAAARGIRIGWSSAPTGTEGRPALSRVEWHRVDAAGIAQPGTGEHLDCDALLVSGGWNPTVHLFSQSAGSLRFDGRIQSFVPARSAQRERSVGAAAGDFGSDYGIAPLWSVDVSALGRSPAYSWVDYASDVTEGDLRLAAREGFSAVEHLKRYTTTGMMSDQGKISNVNAIGILGGVLGRAPGEVGTTRFRPPFDPVTFGTVAGQSVGPFYLPLRRLPTDALLQQYGAVMEDYGGWSRPAYLPREHESEHHAVERELHAVRNGVGLIDYSPLGKILVHGPDAAELLQRIYVNNMRTLKPGACRYGIMLGEDGIVMDDGVLTRWAPDSFQVGTTSGNAERVTEWLEEWLQCEWVDLDVIVEPVTTQWSVVMVAGPNARTLLERLGSDIDFSAAAFPHMTARAGTLGGVPLRVMRVSFTGELSYEVSVPWRYGASLWSQLLILGADLGVTPFGVEALMVMRIEKGFLHVGTETDGSTLPQDIGFGDIIAKKADDFTGRRSTMTPEGLRTDRRQLVGLAPVDARTVLPTGAHATEGAGKARRTIGWVTSSVYSPTLGRPVAMGVVERGRARMGETIDIYDARGRNAIPAVIVAPTAYDPNGERLHV